MKAFSVKQPWAWLIANGYKDVDNRPWPAAHKGNVLVHATKERASEHEWRIARKLCETHGIELPPETALPRGGIVGIVSITGCTLGHCKSPWFSGPVGWQLADARQLDFVPFKGRLSLFETGLEPEPNRATLKPCNARPKLVDNY